MPTTKSELVRLGSHLRGIALRIDRQLESDYGMTLFAEITKNFCLGCSQRLGEPVLKEVEEPYQAAAKLMCKAAGTKLAIPAAPRWELESEFKPNLKNEFYGYVRSLLGECRCASGPKKVSFRSDPRVLWYTLSADADFVLRLIEAYEPYSGRMSLSDFRDGFLLLCIERGVATGVEALPLIAEYTQRAAGLVN